jgi:hypothetical protein
VLAWHSHPGQRRIADDLDNFGFNHRPGRSSGAEGSGQSKGE